MEPEGSVRGGSGGGSVLGSVKEDEVADEEYVEAEDERMSRDERIAIGRKRGGRWRRESGRGLRLRMFSR